MIQPIRKGNYRVGKVAPVVAGMKVGDAVLCEDVGVRCAAFWAYVDYHCLPIRFKSKKTREGVVIRRVA